MTTDSRGEINGGRGEGEDSTTAKKRKSGNCDVLEDE